HQDEENEGDGSYWTERSYGSFYRAIPLPDGVDEDAITADFDNGVLHVTVPVPQQQQNKAKRVQIR
ncbi:MAG: Hsp20/alpha crystallin family protein, partial [Gemmatimonadaceae bacterium]